MLIDIIVYILLTFFVLFIGKSTAKLFLQKDKRFTSIESIFLLGFFLISLVFQIVIFKPLVIILFINFIFFSFIKTKNKKFNFKNIKLNREVLLLILIYLLLLSSISADLVRDYDSYLYHLQSIRWISENPLILGIANLHQRLAFQSIWFNWSSLFGLSEIFKYPLSFLNGWIIFVLFSYFAVESKRHIKDKLPLIVFPILFFIFALKDPLYMILRGYNPDIPAIALTIFFFYFLFKKKSSNYKNIILLIVSLLAFWIKLTALPLLIFTTIEILVSLSNKLIKPNKLITYISLAIIVIVPYLFTNILKSGYLIYPVSISRIDLPWSEKKESVENLQTIISSWAKVGKYDYQYQSPLNISWIQPWIDKQPRNNKLIFFLTILSIISIFFFEKNKRKPFYLLLLFIYWFILAPDFRFGYGAMLSSILIFLIKINKFNKYFINYILFTTTILLSLYINGNIINYFHWMRMVPQLKPWGLIVHDNKEIIINNNKYFIPSNKQDDRSMYHYFPAAPGINNCLQLKTGLINTYYIDCQ